MRNQVYSYRVIHKSPPVSNDNVNKMKYPIRRYALQTTNHDHSQLYDLVSIYKQSRNILIKYHKVIS